MLAEHPVVRRLLASREPAIRYKARVDILGESPASTPLKALAREIAASRLARRLLRLQRTDGRIVTSPQRGQTHPYQKWQGPHFTLVCLAEIGYPSGTRRLAPMRDQFYEWLLAPSHLQIPHTLILPGQEDRVRRCGGQEGYAVWYSLKLGIADERTELLVDRLRGWQWPDGGWNCDGRPAARLSSLHETWIPIRALALHGRLRKDRRSTDAAERAADVLLRRRLFLGARSGKVIDPKFLRVQYPHFYPYNILAGLKTLAEAGFVRDPRCAEALDLLEAKRLRDGGFPLEQKNYVTSPNAVRTRGTSADWGPSGRARSNEFVTADALHILKAAGRL
ncbi:MAG TPA: hypothetical protein VKW04_17990 [Planctomycetota bacterium]|nr:hypothetical protein [Planctomycetota bacterium]